VSILLLTAATASLAVSVPEARAANIFDFIFGGGYRYRQPVYRPEYRPLYREQYQQQYWQGRPAPRNKAQRAAPLQKITGPVYYTYKSDPLVKVDFAPLIEAAVPAAYSVAAQPASFNASLPGLQDYKLLAEREIADALNRYYSANRAFIWIEQGAASPAAKEALQVLGDAAIYGLDPADYAVSLPDPGGLASAPDAQANEFIRFEMALSARLLRYVQDATQGRIDPNRISGYHDLPRKPLNLSGVLNIVAHSNDLRAYLQSRHPQNPEFQALQAELKALEASAETEISVDPKLLLKPGESSPELPKLLGVIADLDDLGGDFGETLSKHDQSEKYSNDLVPLVKAVQKRHGLRPDGVIGPRTVRAIAGTPTPERIEKVRLAMEQLRWLPSDLGSRRVFVNQPAFTASYIDGGDEKLKMRVVIGAPSTQTSFFTDEIEQVDYNPYWGVPQSIIVNEMLPRLRSDPGYLDRAGYEVLDTKGRRIPSTAIDWDRFGSKVPYSVRQIPSEVNALGELKILFPNKHAIYMHDTPTKHLFKRDMRAFSHGCIRLEDPRGMAAAVLGTSVDHVAEKLKNGHSIEKVSGRIPVYVAYFTAWPTATGEVEYFADVYERDEHLKTALEVTAETRAPTS
jgi:murein L,D-transpeptidase YcbB/YkuD